MTSRKEAVEILVHINAPSRASDDAFYRELAEAYLDFEPGCTTALPALPEDQQRHECPQSKEKAAEARSPARHAADASSSLEYATPAPMPPLLDSQDLSFQSALDNRESPRLGNAIVAGALFSGKKSSQDMGGAVESQKSWLPPPSEVGDSYPMPDPSLLRVSPSKVLERYLRSSTSGQGKRDPSPANSSSFLDTSQATNRIEVPSSPPRGWVEVPSSQPEPAALPTIPSSPPLPVIGLSVIPLSSVSEKEGTGQLVPGPDEFLDATQPFSSQPEEEHDEPFSQKEASQSASDEMVEVTHITDSLVEDGPKAPRLKQNAVATVRAGPPQDSLEVTHITSSSLADLSAALHSQKHLQPAVAEDHLGVTHISMSSAGGSPGAAPSQKGELHPRADENLDVTHISGTSFEVTSAMIQHGPDSSPLAKRRRRSADSSPSPVTDAGVAGDAFAADATPSSMSIQPAGSSSLEIIPPSPPVGLHTVHPDDLIPQQLSKLCADLSSRYRPSTPARTLDPLERGHWLLDCDSWPAEARDSTWASLGQYARSGLAGWGLWCRREEKPHRFIKVFCWGHLVKHAYLLLYLASERRLKSTRAVWIDADGEVVIEVVPHVK